MWTESRISEEIYQNQSGLVGLDETVSYPTLAVFPSQDPLLNKTSPVT